jgi:hypothetical protein
MRDDDEFGHYVPLLRRIIILVAVITAVPVVLWTITAFVRAYVAPAKIPTFHQLAATASINAPANDSTADSGASPAERQASTPQGLEQQGLTAQPVMASATTTDAHDGSVAPKGPLLADRSDAAPGTPAPSAWTPSLPATTAATPNPAAVAAPPQTSPAAASTAAAPPTLASLPGAPAVTGSTSTAPPAPAATTAPAAAAPIGTAPKPATTAGASRITDPSMATTNGFAEPPASPWPTAGGAAPAIRVVSNQPADAAEPLPPGRPLTGRIPLPRHRPADLGGLRIADMAPSHIPVPRPRPDRAGSAETGAGPVDFLNNLFGAK